MSDLLVFLASNTHLATRNPKFLTKIKLERGKDLFSWSSSEFGAKFRTEIALFSLTKLQKKYFAPSEFALTTKN